MKEKAAKKTGKRGPRVEEQKELVQSKQEDPLVIRDGFILAHFNKPVHEFKDGNARRIGLEFSFPLVKELNGFIPKKAKAAWEWLLESENKSVAVVGIPAQGIVVKLAPEMDAEIDLKWTEIKSATVQLVEMTGKGNVEEIVRFKFRAWCDQTKNLVDFANWQFGKDLWISLSRSQAKMFEGDPNGNLDEAASAA